MIGPKPDSLANCNARRCAQLLSYTNLKEYDDVKVRTEEPDLASASDHEDRPPGVMSLTALPRRRQLERFDSRLAAVECDGYSGNTAEEGRCMLERHAAWYLSEQSS